MNLMEKTLKFSANANKLAQDITDIIGVPLGN